MVEENFKTFPTARVSLFHFLFLFEKLLSPGRSEPVHFTFRLFSVSLHSEPIHPACSIRVQSGIKRSFFDAQCLARNLLNIHGDPVAVHWSTRDVFRARRSSVPCSTSGLALPKQVLWEV